MKRGVRHASGFAQTADLVGVADVVRPFPRAECRENVAEQAAWSRLAEETCEAEAVFAGDGEREAENRRVEMQVRVAVPVSRREAKGAEFFKLRTDFRGERGFERWAEEVAQTGLCG